jgi:tRNA(Ile)-lysidine synthetase, C-terminal domain
VVIEQPGNYVFANGTLSVKHTDATAIPTDPKVACIDASAIQFPLLLRPWRTGDYFYPLGMPKKKKLSRFFIDNKLSMADKEKVWVVEMNKKIIWVVGYRIDDRFKIKKQTTSVLRLEWK